MKAADETKARHRLVEIIEALIDKKRYTPALSSAFAHAVPHFDAREAIARRADLPLYTCLYMFADAANIASFDLPKRRSLRGEMA